MPRKISSLCLILFLVACTSTLTPTPADFSSATETQAFVETLAYLVGSAPAPTLTPSASPPPSVTPAPTATPLEQPGPRSMADMVFHEGLGMVVMLNGSRTDNRLWGWDGTHWQIIAEGGPNKRELGGVAYDPGRDKLVVYGGRGINNGPCQYDTWEWDEHGWQQLDVPSPTVCSHFLMEYDYRLKKIILFGGGDDQQNIYSDMWTWDGQRWEKLAVETPEVRFHMMSVSDAGHGDVFLLGGFNINNEILDEFWAWDGTAWEQLRYPRPTALSHADMAFDSKRVQLVLFGGTTRARFPFDLKSDTWILTHGAWRRVDAPGPSARGGPALAYDVVWDRVVLYGGFAEGQPALADTWEWDGVKWMCRDGCEPGQATVASPTSHPITLGSNLTLYRGNPQRTGAYAFPALRERPTLLWQKNLNVVGPAPIWADGVLYVSAENGQLCALNGETGAEIWCAFAGDVASPVAVAGDLVFVTTVSGQALAFRRDTGAKIWSVSIRGSGWGAPLVNDEMVYIVSERGVYALEALTGKVIWEKNTGSHRGYVGSPAWEAGVLYFGVGPTLYALESATGAERWKVQSDTWFYGPALANELIYVGNDDGYFYAFDAQTGAEAWKSKLAGTGWSGPSVANNMIYVGNIDQHIYAYDALTGETVWKTEVEDWATTDPLVTDGVVYVGSGNHEMREGPRHLYALDAATGAELWKFQTDARLLTAPALSEDTIYIVSVAGTVYALK